MVLLWIGCVFIGVGLFGVVVMIVVFVVKGLGGGVRLIVEFVEVIFSLFIWWILEFVFGYGFVLCSVVVGIWMIYIGCIY